MHHRTTIAPLRHWARLVVPVLVAIRLAAPLGEPAAEASPVATVHGVVDTACHGGAGTTIPSPASPADAGSEVATTMLPSGVSVVVVSAGFPTAAVATVHAFTPSCAPDASFGQGGSEQLSYKGRDFTINAAAPGVGGGLVLVGQTNTADQIGTGWLVASMGRTAGSIRLSGWAAGPSYRGQAGRRRSPRSHRGASSSPVRRAAAAVSTSGWAN